MTLSKLSMARVRDTFSNITCGENCWKAKEEICRCECGGKNHGIQLREGKNGIRACKIFGNRYELVSVGTHTALFKYAQSLIQVSDIESGKAWYNKKGELVTKSYYYSKTDPRIVLYNPPVRLDCLHPYVLRYATMSQCLRWDELEYFNVTTERERMKSQAAILWIRQDVPTYLKEEGL